MSLNPIDAIPSPDAIRALGNVGGPLLVVVFALFLLILFRDYLLSRKIDLLTERIGAIPVEFARALAADRAENREMIDRLFKIQRDDNKQTLAMVREVIDESLKLQVRLTRVLQSVQNEIKASEVKVTAQFREINLRIDMFQELRGIPAEPHPRELPQPPPESDA